MEKLLDYLNGRHFEVNTLEGAIKAMNHFLACMPDRLANTERVVSNLRELLKNYTPENLSKEDMLKVAMLHNIGYSHDLFFSSFHPYDGGIYLKENGWNREIYNLVMAHSFARELVVTEAKELFPYIMLAERSCSINDLAILALADFTAGPKGELLTLQERVDGIHTRYGADSTIGKHATLVRRTLGVFSLTARIIHKGRS